ncbi:hypothetical protein GA0004736_3429 [Curtobacterium sp. 9128]|uniref:hypothetical protein n=1 Tax=Curtobacterium sp. 9128 TaxID=1793722 RepID=UPI0007D726D7|nr:hypothetical protein [Curtobacterium sp. 9128]SBN64469.1 hypothetical protein GA0004736_3429 [Curtobacterium sp. 9128]
MGLRWHIPLPGPFSLGGRVGGSGTVWKHPGCNMRHRTKHAADTCPNRARLAAKGR